MIYPAIVQEILTVVLKTEKGSSHRDFLSFFFFLASEPAFNPASKLCCAIFCVNIRCLRSIISDVDDDEDDDDDDDDNDDNDEDDEDDEDDNDEDDDDDDG